ncbi:hypothetical protein [Sphingomonas bacterium]|uniref:hypothetical protein n=1 Tax=Sphingomonas bacterium TaxID=1895847 RepID=UPI0015765840|nr:hypothetical protein [Sphingomonas bacterium]
MIPDIDFSQIRAERGDQREGFEEFSAQIFHRHSVAAGSRYERYRGAGGDGGVEAIWRLPSGKVIGLQSKYFLPLKAGHLAQLEKSLDTALDNHPDLETYIVTLPFDPTPTVKARSGDGQAAKLETWRKRLIDRAAMRGATITIEWWHESELKSRLLGMDNSAGRILYWFGSPNLTMATLESAAAVAEGVAGPRYSPRLRVGNDAGNTIKAFCLDPAWSAVRQGWGARLRGAVRVWNGMPPKAHPGPSAQILAALNDANLRFAAVEDLSFTEADRAALQRLSSQTLPIAQALEASVKRTFDSTHGEENDNIRWRQFQSAYQVAFPAADLDHAREACTLLRDILAFAESPAAIAAGAGTLLMRGPAGIGKTHTTIDVTKERVAAGRGALTVLGQEITHGQNLWSVVASKLGIGPMASKSEILGVLAAFAEVTDAPFLICVDAINETPDRQQWRSWLPQLKTDVTGQPIKLLLTCRDIFIEDALGAAADDLPSFTHVGFAGREYDAAYAFAAFYKVGPPAEVVAQPEFANPLFLHLVCRAAVNMKWDRIPGGQISLTKLIAAILDGANGKAAELLDFDVRIENPVRAGALALAKAMGQKGVRLLPLVDAQTTLAGIWPSQGASRSLLRAMEEADLVSVGSDSGALFLRFAFERLGDVLIAQASIADQDKTTISERFFSGDLAALVATAAAVSENAGLIQAYSILLPELHGIEIADLLSGTATHLEVTMLALGVLAWRDLASFTSTAWILHHGRFVDLIDVLGLVLAVAAVPGHPVNAEWLDSRLRSYQQLDRDALWTEALKRAWERGGAGHQLVSIARGQDLSHLSAESAVLLGIALAWFTGSADLLIRDEASMALTRLLVAQPIAGELLNSFILCNDDFIRERVLNSAYGAGLLKRDPAYWHEIADIVFDNFFASGMPPENVLLRDLARLIVEEGVAAGSMASTPAPASVQPPYPSAWPLHFIFPDWAALEAAHPDLPTNLELGKQWQPDFARYIVEPAARDFDLAAAGLTLTRLNQWIVEQILTLGYDGPSRFALAYDWKLIEEHGQERGVPNRHRRVSKKHQWIFLARLLGRLHDHVPHDPPSWGMSRKPTDLQAVELRTLDPTDLSDDLAAPLPGVGVSDFFIAPSTRPEARDAKVWAGELFTDRDIELVGEKWLLLAGYQSWRYEDKASGRYLLAPRRVKAMLVPDSEMSALKKSFASSIPRSDIPELRDLYQGELLQGAAIRAHSSQWSLDAEFGIPASVIVSHFDDPETPTHSLWAPAPDLVTHNLARWDGARSWVDASGDVIAAQIGCGDDVALVFDKTKLLAYLTATTSRIVWLVFENRHASIASDVMASNDLHQAWSWNGKRLTKVAEEQEGYADEDEDMDIAPDGDG